MPLKKALKKRKASDNGVRCLKFVVVLGRIELPATRLGGGCSIQLSYRTTDGILLPFFACPVKACRFLSRKKPLGAAGHAQAGRQRLS